MHTEQQSLVGEVQTPAYREQRFKNADAALDYCKMAQPKSMTLNAAYQLVDGEFKIVEWVLQYKQTEGEA